jgi:hypothetical protein
MRDAIVAIVVKRQSDGRTWTPFNPVGTFRSVGFAGSQEGAMDAARREARQSPSHGGTATSGATPVLSQAPPLGGADRSVGQIHCEVVGR